MASSRLVSVVFVTAAAVGSWFVSLPAQQVPQVAPSLFAEMRWRNIGPFRAGRTKAAAGHPSQPYTFYIGMVNGGVWKTTDAGTHVEADLRRSADGIDRLGRRRAVGSRTSSTSEAVRACRGPTSRSATASTDRATPARRGRTSACATRSRFRRSPSIRRTRTACSSPRSAIRTDRTRSAASFGPPTAARRSSACSSRTRTPAARTSTSIHPTPTSSTPRCGSSVRAHGKTAPGTGTNGGIFKSTDGGTTWTPMTQGLPDGIDQRGAGHRADAIRGGSTRRSKRVPVGPASIDRMTRARAGRAAPPTQRPTSRINEVVPHVHPKDPDTVIVTDIVSYKSTDGGKTFVPFKGAPGGDDNQNIWWNPNNPDIMLLVIDQGAVVTLERRADLELVVHAVDCRALPRHDRQRVSVSRVRRAAGQRIGVCREPRQRRPDHRSASGIRSASRNTGTPRRIRSIPISSMAARSRATTAGPGRCRTSGPLRAGRGGGRSGRACVSDRPHAAGGLFHGRSARAVLRQQRAVEDDRRRNQLEADQP